MLNIRKFLTALGIVPVPSTGVTAQGEMEVLSTNGKLNYHNGTTVSPVVTEAHTATLTNKTISGSNNTITDIAASTAITGQIAIANGGTGQSSKSAAFDALSPMTTGGDLIYGGSSGTGTRLTNGSSGQFLKSNGGTSAPSWDAPSVITALPTVRRITSGSGTYNKNYTFVISSGSATVGATYTNNGVTFTVHATVSSATQVVMSGSGAPTSSGTLTKSGGTGDSTLTFSQFLAPKYLIVNMTGGGGGGACSGSSANTEATAGASSTFGTSLLTAAGGGFNTFGATAAALGGVATVNSPAIDIGSMPGNDGGGVSFLANAGTVGCIAGGTGGASGLGSGAAACGYSPSGPARSAPANTGGGGAGGGMGTSVANNFSGGGGAGAGGIKAIVPDPSATYSYAVGAGGSAGTTLANGFNGGAGGSGIIIITEYYQ